MLNNIYMEAATEDQVNYLIESAQHLPCRCDILADLPLGRKPFTQIIQQAKDP